MCCLSVTQSISSVHPIYFSCQLNPFQVMGGPSYSRLGPISSVHLMHPVRISWLFQSITVRCVGSIQAGAPSCLRLKLSVRFRRTRHLVPCVWHFRALVSCVRACAYACACACACMVNKMVISMHSPLCLVNFAVQHSIPQFLSAITPIKSPSPTSCYYQSLSDSKLFRSSLSTVSSNFFSFF